VVDTIRIEGRGTALDAVHLIAFPEQQFRQVGAILAGHAGDQSNLIYHATTLFMNS
jgi:hypothetical protein